MSERPRISADLLIGGVRGGTVQVTSAMIHPDDMRAWGDRLQALRSLLNTHVIVSSAVERGMLFVSTRSLRR